MRFRIVFTSLVISSLLFVPLGLVAQQEADANSDAALLPPGQKLDKKPPAELLQKMHSVGGTRYVGAVAISPDGKTVAWVSRTEHGSRVMLSRLVSGAKAESRVAVGADEQDCNAGSPAWSPDSKTLAVVSDCADGKQDQVVLVGVGSGDGQMRSATPKQLGTLKGYVDDVAFSPDGGSVGLLYMANATGPAGATAVQRFPEGVIGGDSTQDLQCLAVLPVDGSAVHCVSPASLYVYQYSWSPDGKMVVYTAAPPPGEDNWWNAKVYTQAASGGDPRVVFDHDTTPRVEHGLQSAVPSFSPDGRNIAFIYGLMSDFGPTGGDVVVVSADGGAAKNLTAGMNSTAEWVHWLDNRTVGFSDFERGKSSFRSVGLAGGEPKVLYRTDGSFSAGGAAMSVSFARDNTVAFQMSSFSLPPEVYAGAWGDIKPITQVNAGLKPSPFKRESLEWTNEGQPVQGFVTLPEDYDAQKKWPLIVNVHGGPAAANVNSWGSRGINQFYAAAGYVVFDPNPRGSYGQGEKFTQANRRDFGYGDLSDILAGVDSLEKKYSVDDKRVGITGGSYGGFMSMFAPTQTNRFAASVALAGISNWVSYYGENHIDQWMIPFMGKSAYDDPKAYERLSAITFIKNVKTPMLIIVGDRDGECPAPQSIEMWHALRDENVPVELVIYPNEGHGLSQLPHQMDYLERSLEWFAKYMPAR